MDSQRITNLSHFVGKSSRLNKKGKSKGLNQSSHGVVINKVAL